MGSGGPEVHQLLDQHFRFAVSIDETPAGRLQLTISPAGVSGTVLVWIMDEANVVRMREGGQDG
jgi:hypothetical protein